LLRVGRQTDRQTDRQRVRNDKGNVLFSQIFAAAFHIWLNVPYSNNTVKYNLEKTERNILLTTDERHVAIIYIYYIILYYIYQTIGGHR
jgi:hypothetical protein